MENQAEVQLVLTTCLKAGKMMMASGSEVFRVEDTMKQIASKAGYPDIQTYITVTGIVIGFPLKMNNLVVQIDQQSINLEKVTTVSQVTHRFTNGVITLSELYQQLIAIEEHTPNFPFYGKIIAAGVVSSTLMIILTGSWWDFLPTFLIGLLGYSVHSFFGVKLQVTFLNDFLAAATIGILALLAVKLSLDKEVNSLIIGSIMPLVPGLAITDAFGDIMAGHLISGVARGTEALFIAGAIGGGIIVAFNLF